MSEDCTKCHKQKISPDKRCNCRLDWQINKCYEITETLHHYQLKIEDYDNLQSQLDAYKKLYELQRESGDFYSNIDSWDESNSDMTVYNISSNDMDNYGTHFNETRDPSSEKWIGGKKARQTNKQCDEILTTLNKGDNNV